MYTVRMTKDTLLMAVGAFVAMVPFLGFPHTWDTAFLVLAGAATVALGIAVRRSCAKMAPKRERTRAAAKNDESVRGESAPTQKADQVNSPTSTSDSDEQGGYASA